jgi:hypothetical protein
VSRVLRRVLPAGLALVLVAGLMGLALRVHAQPDAAGSAASPAPGPASVVPPAELERVRVLLEQGAFSEAIAELELWSDRGVLHPDLSFDRGVAYLGRAESPARRRADLGQAVAAFEEARHLDPEDEEAALIIERIRENISSERAKRDADGVVARPRLSRALLGLVGEDVFAGLGALGSLLSSLGAGLWIWARSQRTRLAGGIAAAFGLVLGVLGAGMAYTGLRLRTGAAPAVVVVEDARLLGADGQPLKVARGASTLGEASDRVPEGTLVHIRAERGLTLQVEWGDYDAWLNARDVRRLAAAR